MWGPVCTNLTDMISSTDFFTGLHPAVYTLDMVVPVPANKMIAGILFFILMDIVLI